MGVAKKKIFLAILVLVILVPIAFLTMFIIAPLVWNPWGATNASNGVAINGYDTVAYHKLGQASKGDSAYSVTWNNVEWHFVSAEHRSLFEADPERYAPQFGGYCATAVSIGITVDTDPQSWHIEKGKLYLFFSDDPKQDYIAQIDDGIISRSEKNWVKAIQD